MAGPVTVNGLQSFDTQIRTWAIGAWTADLRVDADAAPTGRVTIVAGARTLSGTVTRSTEFVGTAQIRVVAGNAGMGATATPRPYDKPTVSVVLADLLRDAGEAMAASSDQGVLATAIASWTTAARPIAAVLEDLLALAGARWRVLDDGTVWVGKDTWPDAGISSDAYEIVNYAAEKAVMQISTDGPMALVGKTFEGGRVNGVQDDIPHVESIRARVFFEADEAPAAADRLRAGLQRLVRGTPTGVDLRFRYWSRVVTQSDGTVDADPEIAGVPDMGQVPLAAQAGDQVDGVQGGRVLVGWAGNGSQRVAHGFDGDAVPTTRVLKVLGMLFLGDSQGAQLALLGAPHQAAEAALVQELIAAFTTLGGASQGPLAPLAPGFAAVVAAFTAFQVAAQAANNFLSSKVSVAP